MLKEVKDIMWNSGEIFPNCRYCFGPRTWSRLSDLPEALAHHTMTLVDRLLYIVGGLTSQQTLSNSILKF